MKAGRELIILVTVLFLLVSKLPGSDDSLPFYFGRKAYVEVIKDNKPHLVALSEARKQFIVLRGRPLESGDSLRYSEDGLRRERMKGGTLLLLGQPVNVNEADARDLMAISGIGPKTAEAIIKYRNKKGPFKSLQDLVKVRGIGRKRLAKMKKFLVIK